MDADLTAAASDNSLPSDAAPAQALSAPKTDVERARRRIAKWRARLSDSILFRKTLIPDWQDSVDYRQAKPFGTDSAEDRVQVPIDWALVKSKQAQLFSQVPQVRLTPKSDKYAQVVPMFGKKLNDTITTARVGVAMDEVLPDVINAAGIGAVLVAYESRRVMKPMTLVNPDSAAEMKTRGETVPTTPVPQKTDSRFTCTRISPADYLTPVEFTGSDFDDAPWQGNSGRTPWASALSMFGQREGSDIGLTADDYDKVVKGDARKEDEKLTTNSERERSRETDVVNYHQIFYWRYLYHADEPSFKAIHRLVFVEGKTDPVVDEPWQAQRRGDDGITIIGPCKFPVRVLTLTYISDESIPPSDSAIIRPQVNEMNRSRSQMIVNREASKPMRWFNTNLVAQEVQVQLLDGTWQGMIPVNGDGARMIGEVARAAYPKEDFDFVRVIQTDIDNASQTGPKQGNESGATAIRSASEAQISQQNFQTRVGYERARTVKFFVGIAEVLAGLYARFGEFTDEDKQAMGDAWNPTELPEYFVYDVRADASVLLDAKQRYDRLTDFLDRTGKSGFINPKPIIQEMAELAGVSLDVVIDPPQKGLDPANVSLRLDGADMSQPLLCAMAIKMGIMPSPEELAAAIKLLQAVQAGPASPVLQPHLDPTQPGAPGAPPDPNAPPAPPSAGPGVPPGRGPLPPAPASEQPQPVGTAHPNWDTMPHVDKRSMDGRK